MRLPISPVSLLKPLPLVAVFMLISTNMAASTLADETPLDFAQQVRPILARHCFKCHGPDPDAREAGLRLDQQEGSRADLGGYAAIVPGDPNRSEAFLRVTSDDSDLRMPPPESGDSLNRDEVDVLKAWIQSGGQYQTHWSFVTPESPLIPDVASPQWCRDSIDRFILKRIEAAKLQPTPRASRETLIRRLYLDLTGTTPSPDAVDRFIHDSHPAAEKKLIDRLLASPEYGERFARSWLDLARYSDTNGYEKDRPRSIWPYRDWVIDALANDMPFDQFSIEQLAGDMLPNATSNQRIATGFHRNTMLNEEGGIDPLEYRYYAMVDRVATTGTVWMGMTIGCAQCHTHKYDPITHNDYFSMMALMNQADEPDVLVEDPARDQRKLDLERRIGNAVDQLADQYLPTLKQTRRGEKPADEELEATWTAFRSWIQKQVNQSRSWQPIRPTGMTSTMPKLTVLDDDSVLAGGDVTKRDVYRLHFELDEKDLGATALRLEVLPHDSLPAGGPGMAFYEGRRGDFFLSELSVVLDDQVLELDKPSHSYGNISVGSGNADAGNVLDGEGSTGWSTSGNQGQANQLVVNFTQPLTQSGTLTVELLFERHFAAALGRFRFSLTSGPSPSVASNLPVQWDAWLHEMNLDRLSAENYRQLQRRFVLHSDTLSEQRKNIKRLQDSLPEQTRTLGMRERKREDYRSTHRHHRGEYLQPKEVVQPNVPELFRDAGDPNSPRDRLELARWLVSPANPLVGRVTVNRAWREFFGSGIVDTAGDFGTQSQPPSHPQLLDHLAIDLVENGWSLKRLHRKILGSATYRQAIGASNTADPENRLLAVFPQRRFTGEQIRDAFLSAAGALAHRMGGPSVYPPQPESVMKLAYGGPAWPVSRGADRVRRSLYTFSKRTAPFAAYAIFDGPTGEVCLARRSRSTTPLQALTLLNDDMFLEIAGELAEQTLRDVGPEAKPETIIRQMFRRLLVRDPRPGEAQAILEFYEGLAGKNEDWMLVARALMNLDEAMTTP